MVPHAGPEQELALLVCGTRERREGGEGRVRELAARADFELLASVLDGHRLLALAGSRLIELAGDAFPPSFHRHVGESARLTAMQAVAVDSTAGTLQDELDRRGIANAPLKGSSLARRLYSDMSHRASADVDVLVARADLDAALAVVQEQGYLPPADPLVAGGLPELHYTCEPRHDWLPQIELHWRVHWFETGFSSALLASAAADATGIRRPAAAYDLAALLLFFGRDGFIGLRYAADIAAWWDAYEDELGPAGLGPVLRFHPELSPALRVAAVVSERLGGPAATLVLGRPPELSRRELRAVWLSNWTGEGDKHQLAANRAFVDWVLRPPAATRAFVRRHLRPPPETIAKMYGLPPDAALRRRFWGVFHGPKYAVRLSAASIAARRRGRSAPAVPDAGGASSTRPRALVP